MRLNVAGCRSLLVTLLALAATPLIGGCGGKARRPAVRVSITAPADGARVAVGRLEVAGTVDPGRSGVTIAGRPARVIDGAFSVQISLRRGINRIRVVASAEGYIAARLSLTVHGQAQPTSLAAVAPKTHPSRHPTPHRRSRPRPPSFAARANTVCREAHTRAAPGVSPQSFLAIGLAALRKLEAIVPPRSEAAAYAALLATVRKEGRGLVEELVAAYAKGDRARTERLLGQVIALEQKVDAQAAALGLQVCAYPVPTG